MENEITVLFVSYHSEDIIEKSIMTIDKNIKIIENPISNKTPFPVAAYLNL